MSGCHCLCFKNHPEQEGICVGPEDLRLTFWLEGVEWPIPMCSQCAAATLAAASTTGDGPFSAFIRGPRRK